VKPIALQLYTLRQAAAENLFGVLKQVAEIGYKGVEPAGLHGHDPREVRKCLDDLGLVCPSAHTEAVTAENLARQVDTAAALGCRTLIWGAGRNAFGSAEQVRAAAEGFQAAAALLKPHGLKAGYHNHWWEMADLAGGPAYEAFLAWAPDAAAELDLYWAADFGRVDVPALVRRIRPRVALVHVKDGPLERDAPQTAVGSGKMDIPACLAAADPDVLTWLVVELDHCATDMMQAVRDSYAYLVGAGLAEGNK
jgi:sugar phosphate isomerase/epimerase